MNTKRVDLLNIGIVIVSLIIAIKIPFKLFLFSYAILGPLHYLTEITWLKDKNYFIKSSKNWIWLLFAFTFFKVLVPVLKATKIEIGPTLTTVLNQISTHSNLLLLVGFIFSIGLIFFNDVKRILITLVLSVLFSVFVLYYLPDSILFIGIFLPTLIHVYLFTFLFVLYGALKSKSRNGIYLSVLIGLIPFIISVVPLDILDYKLSELTKDTFIKSNILAVSRKMADLMGGIQGEKFYALSDLGLRLQIFISFAYTYHYLNWFSKTSIIGWQKAITKKNFYVILIVWFASVGLYLYDFRTGFIALFFLSFLHVFLEFPLNIMSIKGIFTSFFKHKKG